MHSELVGTREARFFDSLAEVEAIKSARPRRTRRPSLKSVLKAAGSRAVDVNPDGSYSIKPVSEGSATSVNGSSSEADLDRELAAWKARHGH